MHDTPHSGAQCTCTYVILSSLQQQLWCQYIVMLSISRRRINESNTYIAILQCFNHKGQVYKTVLYLTKTFVVE